MVITSNGSYDKLIEYIIMHKRYPAVSSLVREHFLSPMQSNEDVLYSEICKVIDNNLSIFEEKINNGEYDYYDEKTDEWKKGSFHGVNESETLANLVSPVMKLLFVKLWDIVR